jgi:hypothetical protein
MGGTCWNFWNNQFRAAHSRGSMIFPPLSPFFVDSLETADLRSNRGGKVDAIFRKRYGRDNRYEN